MNIGSVDLVVVGGGAVGLSCCRRASQIGLDCIVLDGNKSVGSETSSRNSGVLHAGIYYPANTLKQRFCIEGNKMLLK